MGKCYFCSTFFYLSQHCRSQSVRSWSTPVLPVTGKQVTMQLTTVATDFKLTSKTLSTLTKTSMVKKTHVVTQYHITCMYQNLILLSDSITVFSFAKCNNIQALLQQ